MSKLRWFGFGTSGQNQTFGSIQTRSVMLIFISSFKILIIFNSGRIKQTCATLVFRKILTLLRMWRHHSASLQKYSKVEYIKERQSPYLCCVFYFKSISCLVFAWEHNKKDTFSQYSKFCQMSILYIYCRCNILYMVFVIYRAWQSAKTLTEQVSLRHGNSYISWLYQWISLIFGISM